MDDMDVLIQDVGPRMSPIPITFTVKSMYKMNNEKAREFISDLMKLLKSHLIAATISSDWGHNIPMDIILNQTPAQAANPPARIDESLPEHKTAKNTSVNPALSESRQLTVPERQLSVPRRRNRWFTGIKKRMIGHKQKLLADNTDNNP